MHKLEVLVKPFKHKLSSIYNIKLPQPRLFSKINNSTSLCKHQEEDLQEKPMNVSINEDLINHLERTSLVNFGNVEALERLQEAISFANNIFEVDCTGVEPMVSVLENETLLLRKDEAVKTSRQHILLNASITDEDYFVAPPGNIPIEKGFVKDH